MSISYQSLRVKAAERLAKRFHEAYERLAPQFGYKSRFSGLSWADLPENNRLLMKAVCYEVIRDENLIWSDD